MIALLLAILLTAWFACGIAGLFALLLLQYREKGYLVGPLDNDFACWGMAALTVLSGPLALVLAIEFVQQLRAGDEYLRQIKKEVSQKHREAAQ